MVLGEHAQWVQTRAPALWADACAEMHAMYGDDIQASTRAVAPLLLALWLAGELSTAACVERLRPFTQLERTRAHYRDLWVKPICQKART